MIKIYPHLGFDGHCEEAFLEYQRIFGGTITTMMRYGDSPMAKDAPADWQDRIIHASLHIGDVELAGTDMLPQSYKKPQGFSVILNLPKKAEAQKIFDALSIGGEVQLAFAETFWSAGFGVLVDRFGTPWEINCEQAPQTNS
ncbi:MAG: VOC family protein [Cellvibrio sp.]